MHAYRLILATVGLALMLAAVVFALPVGFAVAGFSCCASSFIVHMASGSVPPKRPSLPDPSIDPWDVSNLPRELRTLDGNLKPYEKKIRQLDADLAADKITSEDYAAKIAAIDKPAPAKPLPRVESASLRTANEWLANARRADKAGQVELRNYYLKRAYSQLNGTDYETVQTDGDRVPAGFIEGARFNVGSSAPGGYLTTLDDAVRQLKEPSGYIVMESRSKALFDQQMQYMRTLEAEGRAQRPMILPPGSKLLGSSKQHEFGCAVHVGNWCDCGA